MSVPVYDQWTSEEARVPGDRGARGFPEFYAATWPELGSYAASLVGGSARGADLAQEALARVYARWSVLRQPRPYAFRIVTNLAKDQWRRQDNERKALALVDASSPSSAAPAYDAVLDAVRRLPGPLREVVLLHYYADLPVNEVARVLRRPAGTVKSRLFDARAALATALEDAR